MTPLPKTLLLEKERRSWREIARGTPEKLVAEIAGDTQGTFHGLGALDRVLREAGNGLNRLPMAVNGDDFVYAESGEVASVQEALFHFFGLPIEVICEPEAEDLKQELDREPFVPLRLHLASGKTTDIAYKRLKCYLATATSSAGTS